MPTDKPTAARELAEALPYPWERSTERPDNVECVGCGFEMWSGHIDPDPAGCNSCLCCGKGEAAKAAHDGGGHADA